ncbi:unnamed protein product [Candidula unifasciata]|uniref:Rab-GAP TBC domain-containing protein n=1 Tax=Candidula unifasciata TaxID=100452 RepID=A0A8S3ZTM4_9EUPU|nr:unnamed protein product [Candidula unifasciata]
MAGFYNMDQKEVIRIKVKKCDGKTQAEYKKFSIDPQITSFEMLQGILAKAFEIRSDFTISYMTYDSEGQNVYQSMLSDWDMDAAFQCASEPYLKLRVDVRLFEDLEDWDVIAPVEIPHHQLLGLVDKHSILSAVTGSITHKLVRTVSSMQRAMGFKHPENGVTKPAKLPMCDTEFRNYLDSSGFMIKPNEFRQSVYQGGIEHSLRRVAWRHLLSIYPAHLSSKDRFRYLKCKEEEYRKLKEEWCEKLRNGAVMEEVKHVVNMVEKDVLRTDRSHSFYSGSDENKNTLSLFHILVTFALTHPDVSYCQGMSDLASPLLVTQKNEGQAYICFCALMRRLHTNFTTEGSAIMMKFHHLSELLNMYDPVLYEYLLQNSAGDMFFCYRWFLLEMKREFPFNDALHVLEVMWATLPHCPPQHEIKLADAGYSCQLLSTSPGSPTFSQQHNMYTKLLALRRGGILHRGTQTANSTASVIPRANNNMSTYSLSHCDDVRTNRSSISSFDTSPSDREVRDTSFPKIDHSVTYCVHQKLDNIQKIDNIRHVLKNRQLYEHFSTHFRIIDIKATDTSPKAAGLNLITPKTLSPLASRYLPFRAETDKSEITKNLSDSLISDCQEATEEFGSSETTCSLFTGTPVRDPSKLPPPQEFGAGNPFLMFLSLTLLLQHREFILSQEMCYEEIAMYFDRLVRKHDANHTLQFTRQMYMEYLRAQQANVKEDEDLEFNLNF